MDQKNKNGYRLLRLPRSGKKRFFTRRSRARRDIIWGHSRGHKFRHKLSHIRRHNLALLRRNVAAESVGYLSNLSNLSLYPGYTKLNITLQPPC